LTSQTMPASAQVPHCGRCLSPACCGFHVSIDGQAATVGLRDHLLHRNFLFRHSSQADPGSCRGWPVVPDPWLLPVRLDAAMGFKFGK
jgi:hypothetical protein